MRLGGCLLKKALMYYCPPWRSASIAMLVGRSIRLLWTCPLAKFSINSLSSINRKVFRTFFRKFEGRAPGSYLTFEHSSPFFPHASKKTYTFSWASLSSPNFQLQCQNSPSDKPKRSRLNSGRAVLICCFAIKFRIAVGLMRPQSLAGQLLVVPPPALGAPEVDGLPRVTPAFGRHPHIAP